MKNLKTNDERFFDIKIGISEGEVIGEFDEQGNLLPQSYPVGVPMSEAMRTAT
ncbi:MAG: hypothetical protein OEV42_16145 [Deltaproteobacteria bacterium]|nr:hypothetical protein [Deltaproteobacteria bacterium]